MQHKFKVGQTVSLTPSVNSRFEVTQSFTITRQMPECDGELQYRLKGEKDLRERVVKERELSKA